MTRKLSLEASQVKVQYLLASTFLYKPKRDINIVSSVQCMQYLHESQIHAQNHGDESLRFFCTLRPPNTLEFPQQVHRAKLRRATSQLFLGCLGLLLLLFLLPRLVLDRLVGSSLGLLLSLLPLFLLCSAPQTCTSDPGLQKMPIPQCLGPRLGGSRQLKMTRRLPYFRLPFISDE